jgi:tRNA nucleotidyltransferase (CCA-adding enzyme)
MMETYLVGGAVRDELLGLPVIDRDWVVVGSNEEAMLNEGYERVGKDFPVFLHPISKEEYALARTERKTAAGHQGFECDASDSVTLEEDLMRRDLTINAIAKSANGDLIDPQKGTLDIQLKILRHVSPAFCEDPLRILRIARFFARFEDFAVAQETIALLRQMINEEQLDELAVERIWVEVTKALETHHPARFFQLLRELGAHDKLWPVIPNSGIDRLTGLTSKITEPELRFAGLCSQSGHGLRDHLKRMKVPNRFADLALAANKHMDHLLLENPSPESILKLLMNLDALRRPQRFHDLLRLAQSIKSLTALQPLFDWNRHFQVVQGIGSDLVDPNLKGKDFGDALSRLRLEALKALKSKKT